MMQSAWQEFIDLADCEYLQAELVAIHRAVNQLRLKGKMNFEEWITDAIEFAGLLTLGAKYRDFHPRLWALGNKYGMVHFDGDIDEYENWKTTTVTITAKGYLAEYSEWSKELPAELVMI